MPLDHEGLHEDLPASISTYTRGRIDPLNAKPADVDILDIAAALARQCRYNGHTAGHLSVARHSIWVADRVRFMGGDLVLELTGLLHDASEAYLGDMVKPLKSHPAMSAFLEAELRLESIIAERFELPDPLPDIVKEADRWVTVEYELGQNIRWTWHGTYQRDETDFFNRFQTLVWAR